MVHTRMSYWLEKRQKLTPNQAGFRPGHSTIDQIAQTAFDVMEKKKPERAVLTLLDFTKAYDRVWRA